MTYKEYIQNIINIRGQWGLTENYEMHHIIPKCVGGIGDYSDGHFKKKSLHENCIYLTYREHFIAHKLLAEENPDNAKLLAAYTMMAFPKGKTKRDYEITPDEYEELKKICIKLNSLRDRSNYDYSRMRTEEFRKNLAKSATGRIAYNNGEKEIHLKSNDKIPEGFIKGALYNSSYASGKGKKYFNNGTITIRAFECPEGFVPGRIVTSHMHTHNKESGLNRHWYNNGIINKFTYECPAGFVKGKLIK